MLKSTHLFFLLSLFLSNTVFAASKAESFPVLKHGNVLLMIPNGWVSHLKQPKKPIPPTILLTSEKGQPFEVYVSPWWLTGESQTVNEAVLREQVAEEAKEMEGGAVETDIPVQEMTGVDGHGYYFTVTDPAPKPDEFKYMAKGLLRLDNLTLAFTVFTNDGQSEIVEEALKVITTAEHK